MPRLQTARSARQHSPRHNLSLTTSLAEAQLTLGSLDRTISGRIGYGTGVATSSLDNFADPGPYNHDLLLDEGGFLVSGNHNTSIVASATNLSVSGTFSVAVSATDASATVYQEAANFFDRQFPGVRAIDRPAGCDSGRGW